MRVRGYGGYEGMNEGTKVRGHEGMYERGYEGFLGFFIFISNHLV